MSFDPRFQSRWETVLEPGLAAVKVEGNALAPFRVDLGKGSDAILTEILQQIGNSMVIVADISTVGELDGKPIRNANVLYEVGVAHATRQPQEVILFRSDRERLDFDVAGVRVHEYDPDGNPAAARVQVTQAVSDSLGSLQENARLSVRWAAERLTLPATRLLLEVFKSGKAVHPSPRTMGEVMALAPRIAAIDLLLALGAITSRVIHLTPDLLKKLIANPGHDVPMLDYALTSFGNRLAQHVLSEMGAYAEGMREVVEGNKPTA